MAGPGTDKEYFSLRELFISEALEPMNRFLRMEASSSILLLLGAAFALIWANSYFAEAYTALWHTEFAVHLGHSSFGMNLLEWINEGLMAFFFLLIGLEIKREILVGELSSLKAALLPVIGAFGGMVVPGLVYSLFNWGTPQMSGWAIPMATDVAFALGALALLGRGLPSGLRIFLAAFAIADDIGGVLIIAFFYTGELSLTYLALSGGMALLMALAGLLRFRSLFLFGGLGIILWVCVFYSGVHSTIAGVVVALLIPARGRYGYEYFYKKVSSILDHCKDPNVDACYWFSMLMDKDYLDTAHQLRMASTEVEPPFQRLEHAIHPWVAFVILPLFALANAGVMLQGASLGEALMNPVTLGIILGLFVGKPIGVFLACQLAVRLGVASLPEGVNWIQIASVALLGGIGFTVSLFISGLSFVQADLLNFAKLGVLMGSAVAGVLGAVFLKLSMGRNKSRAQSQE
jgi:NhaA family Na+:H+ antiporter